MSDAISEKQFVGVDLHLHRSVICRIDSRGQQLECVQIDNDPKALVEAVRAAGRGAPVAVEATYGWYWAVDALQAAKFEVHLAPSHHRAGGITTETSCGPGNGMTHRSGAVE